ncbi:MAG: flagellar basal-body rod protein FlgF [Deltaproteobacteria bacterium RIFOXYD12_FULL_57_12]|nr:MAG: flagellar basal-body rod protein FlgF [Deltaproteobacteria bacterium RIFOXYD12_FULL_57_12]
MPSGFYSALSGGIAKMQAMETISHNLSNVNTSGFKRGRTLFEALMSSATQTQEAKGINLTKIRGNHVDFAQGYLQTTGGELDFAIEGEGFFKVQGDDGIFYTRSGQFQRGNDGTLLTNSNYKVLDSSNQPIILPATSFEVDEGGNIFTEGGEAGRLALFTAENANAFYKQNGTMFALPAGNADREVEKPVVVRGSLESSNINIMQEMALMIDAQRTFEAYQKAMKTYSTIGSKLDELGSVG